MALKGFTASIREHVASKLRREHPYMKTQTLEKLLDSLAAHLCLSLQVQSKELQETKARASFFMLPRELRDAIYELVLVSSSPLMCRPPKRGRVSGLCRWRTMENPHGEIPLEILCTSRQVRQEALPILLGSNTFTLTLLCSDAEKLLAEFELKALRCWSTAVGKAQFGMIKRMELCLRPVVAGISGIERHEEVTVKRCADAVCKRTGATPSELRADLPVKEWNTSIVVQCLPLEELGMDKGSVELTISTYKKNEW